MCDKNGKDEHEEKTRAIGGIYMFEDERHDGPGRVSHQAIYAAGPERWAVKWRGPRAAHRPRATALNVSYT